MACAPCSRSGVPNVEAELIESDGKLTFHRTSNPAYINKIANGHKEGFVRFVKAAVASRETQEYAELHGFLFRCFNFADSDFDGLVDEDGFFMMVERAASLPRMFGFAPTNAEMFKTTEECRQARAAMFRRLKPNAEGRIGFDKWLRFCYGHICEKSKVLDLMFPALSVEESGQFALTRPLPRLGNFDREGFREFLTTACRKRSGMEYRELYRWLQQSFSAVDTDLDGRIAYSEFDLLVNITAAEPRRLGYAPSVQESYATQVDKIEGRLKMFKEMDTDDTGFIGFDAFLGYMTRHIQEKVKTIDTAKEYNACQCTFVAERPDHHLDTMPMDKASFVTFVEEATSDREGQAYATLYRFLLRCFNESDTDFDGVIARADVDMLLERAAVLPRMFGYAPTSSELFKTAEERVEARTAIFEQMDVRRRGAVSFEEWLDWCYSHICKKAKLLDLAQASRKLGTFTRQEFAAFIIKASEDRTSIEYKELYRWLLDCFREADADKDGLIGPGEFAKLVDLAAAEPRRLGFAPRGRELFASKLEQVAARQKMFEAMDTEEAGQIGFHQFLAFTYAHICEKAKTLAAPGPPRPASSGCVLS